MNEFDYRLLLPNIRIGRRFGKTRMLTEQFLITIQKANCLGNLMFSNMKKKNQERLNKTLKAYIDRATKRETLTDEV